MAFPLTPTGFAKQAIDTGKAPHPWDRYTSSSALDDEVREKDVGAARPWLCLLVTNLILASNLCLRSKMCITPSNRLRYSEVLHAACKREQQWTMLINLTRCNEIHTFVKSLATTRRHSSSQDSPNTSFLSLNIWSKSTITSVVSLPWATDTANDACRLTRKRVNKQSLQ